MKKFILVILLVLPLSVFAQNYGENYQDGKKITDGGMLNGTYHNFRKFYIENRSKIKIDMPGVESRRKRIEKAKEVQKTAPRTHPRRTANSKNNRIGGAPKNRGGYRQPDDYDEVKRREAKKQREAERKVWVEAEAMKNHADQLKLQADVFNSLDRAENFKPTTKSDDMMASINLNGEKEKPLAKVDPAADLIPLDDPAVVDEEEDLDPTRLVARYEAGDDTLTYNQMDVVIRYYEEELAAYNSLVDENTNNIDVENKIDK